MARFLRTDFGAAIYRVVHERCSSERKRPARFAVVRPSSRAAPSLPRYRRPARHRSAPNASSPLRAAGASPSAATNTAPTRAVARPLDRDRRCGPRAAPPARRRLELTRRRTHGRRRPATYARYVDSQRKTFDDRRTAVRARFSQPLAASAETRAAAGGSDRRIAGSAQRGRAEARADCFSHLAAARAAAIRAAASRTSVAAGLA